MKNEALVKRMREWVEGLKRQSDNGQHMNIPSGLSAGTCWELANELEQFIKAALEAKDEPEYYGLTKDHLWMSISKEHYDRLKPEFRMACYTTPPQRKPLTDEEIKSLDYSGTRIEFVRAIEAAHGIKGEA